jgi:hypothetical protein
MPINTKYEDMIHNFSSEYKGGKVVCRKLTDGGSICASQKAWSVFFAYIRKKGLDETEEPKDEKSLMLDSADVAALEPKVINVKTKDKQNLEFTVDDILLRAHMPDINRYCIDNLGLDIIHSYAHTIEDTWMHDIVVDEMNERGIKHLNYAQIDNTIWDTSTVKTFPDSSFACIDVNGRHLPYKDKDGKIDPAHVRNALARLPITQISVEDKLEAKTKLLNAAREVGIKTEALSDESLMKYGWVDGYGGYGGYAYGYTQPQPPVTPSDYKIVKNQLGYYDIICTADGIVKSTCDTEEMAKAYVQKLCIEQIAPQYM